MMNFSFHRQDGFTLLEIIVVVGLLAIITTILLVAISPGRQFAQARNAQRKADLLAISTAISAYMAENQGELPHLKNEDEVQFFPKEKICIGDALPCFNLSQAGTPAFIPTFLAKIPQDPSTGTAANTQYFVHRNTHGQLVFEANEELGDTIIIRR